MSLLSGKQSIASIHRYLKNQHQFICKCCDFEAECAISDGQLRRIFRSLDWEKFNAFMEQHFEITVTQLKDNEWIAIDGKELRGCNEVQADGTKEKRSITIVNAVGHHSEYVIGQSFFEGKKSSEREAVYDLIKAKFQGRKLTLDALHCIPKTLCFIASHEGYYIVQVKANQKEMLADLMKMRDYLPLMYEKTTTDKGHGRIEERTYHCYDIREEYFAPRWNNANIKTLIIVKRKCTHIKTGELTDETSYYISNQGISKKEKKNSQQLCHAVRGHWRVENHHQIRDVTLKEDNFRTPKDNTTKFLAVARSWVINLYRRKKTDNFAAAVQNTAENQNKIRKLFKIK